MKIERDKTLATACTALALSNVRKLKRIEKMDKLIARLRQDLATAQRHTREHIMDKHRILTDYALRTRDLERDKRALQNAIRVILIKNPFRMTAQFRQALNELGV